MLTSVEQQVTNSDVMNDFLFVQSSLKHWAERGAIEVERQLWRANISVDIKSISDQTLIMLIVQQLYSKPVVAIELIDSLLQQGLAINAKDSAGDSALILAIRKGAMMLVLALLERGADSTAVNLQGDSAQTLGGELIIGLAAQQKKTINFSYQQAVKFDTAAIFEMYEIIDLLTSCCESVEVMGAYELRNLVKNVVEFGDITDEHYSNVQQIYQLYMNNNCKLQSYSFISTAEKITRLCYYEFAKLLLSYANLTNNNNIISSCAQRLEQFSDQGYVNSFMQKAS